MPLRWPLRVYAEKWRRRAEAAQQDYIQAVTAPDTAQRWKARVSDPNVHRTYNDAMRQVIEQNLWGATMSAIPAEAYAAGVRAKAGRRVEGIRIAGNKWEARFQPFYEALRNVLPSLPPRGPALSDNNVRRAHMVWEAMHNTKLRVRGLAGGGGVVAAGYSAPASAYGLGGSSGGYGSEVTPPAPEEVGSSSGSAPSSSGGWGGGF